uniref:EF-hand domain-containing protein n=1 Tax=Strigamia maritima TaxID=126957 RepID=T1IY91_STRMM
MSAMDESCDDTELRDLVAQTLENNGVLNKIRAQLRASVFLAIEDQPSNENKCQLINKKLKEFVNTDDGQTVACLIREFLEYFNLEFTQSVFTPETEESIQYNYHGREKLLEELGFDKSKHLNSPVLLQVLHRSQTSPTPLQLSPKNISNSKEMFNSHDRDKNGKINKESVSDLLMDMFPNFRRCLIDRFVSDEYETWEKDFNAELTFDEFCTIYKNLFSICQSVALHDKSRFLPSNKFQKPKMSTVETISISPKSSSIGVEKNDFSVCFKQNSDADSQLAVFTNFSIMNDPIEGDDSFYDDPPSHQSSKSKPKPRPRPKSDLSNASNRFSAGSETANAHRDALPPLVTTRNQDTDRDSPLLATLERDINSKLADLNEDYDEDFQSSEQKSGSDGSIGEEIEEDTSAFGDILGSSASGISLQGNDNVTTDKTVSQISHSGADYLESFNEDSGKHLLQ